MQKKLILYFVLLFLWINMYLEKMSRFLKTFNHILTEYLTIFKTIIQTHKIKLIILEVHLEIIVPTSINTLHQKSKKIILQLKVIEDINKVHHMNNLIDRIHPYQKNITSHRFLLEHKWGEFKAILYKMINNKWANEVIH